MAAITNNPVNDLLRQESPTAAKTTRQKLRNNRLLSLKVHPYQVHTDYKRNAKGRDKGHFPQGEKVGEGTRPSSLEDFD